MTPTADQVARAIVAACREFSEDPIAIARGEFRSRGRHYALHALLRLFPSLTGAKAAALVGAPGKAKPYFKNSCYQVAKVVSPSGRRQVNWWDEDAFDRVVAAVKAAAPIAEDVVDDEPEDDPLPPRAPIKLTATVESIVEPTRPAAVPGKRKLEDMLRAAVQNTQRMTPPPE